MNREISNVQNPALGAAVIWRFTHGYYREKCEPVPFPLLFVVLPIVFREELCDLIIHTQKGLPKLSEKLFSNRQNDNLYSINNTAKAQRGLTFDSIAIAATALLISIDVRSAMVYPINAKNAKGLNDSTMDMMKAAEKLGIWCSRCSLQEICQLMKVRF